MDWIVIQNSRTAVRIIDKLGAVVAHYRYGICNPRQNALSAAGKARKEMRLNKTFSDQKRSVCRNFINDAVRSGR